MSIINKRKPLAVALGAAFVIGGAAQASPLFVASDLAAGYMVASIDDKAGEHSCGEGGCGADMKAKPTSTKDAAQKNSAEAKAAADKAAADKAKASESKPK
ncbi:hypothetical protein [uncultured Nevskia sp.]|uniref:hypothetical protein n=1 Tax=uncultured Nevskia sp. TaxID=228950 RepID=UPI0025D3D5AB|nr:hypothetical protein [uncultured Nevskia sp.]